MLDYLADIFLGVPGKQLEDVRFCIPLAGTASSAALAPHVLMTIQNSRQLLDLQVRSYLFECSTVYV